MKEKDKKPVKGKSAEKKTSGKKPFVAPTLTKYGTVKDVYKGPSCKALIGYTDDK